MTQPNLEQREQKLSQDSKVWTALFAVVLVSLAFALSAEINRPWINGVDFNGAVWSQSAHNILRAGLIETSGASSGFYFGPLPIPDWGYYLHHPPLLHLVITGLFAILGEHEWVARLVPVFCSLTSAVFLWLLVRSCVGARAATLSAAVFAFLPMQLRYGPMVNFEPCVLMLMLGLLLCLRWHQLTGNRWWKHGALGVCHRRAVGGLGDVSFCDRALCLLALPVQGRGQTLRRNTFLSALVSGRSLFGADRFSAARCLGKPLRHFPDATGHGQRRILHRSAVAHAEWLIRWSHSFFRGD